MKKTGKVIGAVIGLMGGLLIVSVLVLYGIGQMRLKKVYDVNVRKIEIPMDIDSLSEGKRIFQYRGCEACHGENLEGFVYLDNPAVGKVITPNLTDGLGGIGIDRTDEDLVRAICHGLRPDGTPLLFMPSTEFFYLDPPDLGKILAYIRSVPPVDNEMPASRLSFTGFIAMNLTRDITFLAADLIQHDQPPPSLPAPGISPEYGQYLAISCAVCHGPGYSGGEIPGLPPEWPAAPNLTSGQGSRLPSWGETGFIKIIREGRKHGRVIQAAYMPWKSYRHMNDNELRAVYVFLMSLPARDFGNH